MAPDVVGVGMDLGYADPGAPDNAKVTERTPAGEFARFEGFGDTKDDCIL